jgi:uncharacterized protein YndB with AHSA1/START domain
MTQQAVVEPVRQEVRVAVPPARAFAAFTAEFSAWWPLDSHHIGEVAATEVVIEPHAGGRWFERGTDGSESEWGRVVAWEPPHRLLLAWQLDQEWRHDPGLTTEIEVRFVPDGDGTQVQLEHRRLERFAEHAEQMRAVLGSDGGWLGLLRRFAVHAAG